MREAVRLAALLGAEAAASSALYEVRHHDSFRVDWSDFFSWAQVQPPDYLVASLVYHAAVVATGWLVATTLLYAATSMLGLKRSRRLAATFTQAWIRRLVDGVAAGTLALSLLTVPARPALASSIPVMAVTHDDEPVPRGVIPPGLGAITYAPADAIDAGLASADTYVVVRGDNLWRIAHGRLTSLGDDPSKTEIGAYWHDVIDANTGRLRSGDPNLIYPGEIVVLPPVAGA